MSTLMSKKHFALAAGLLLGVASSSFASDGNVNTGLAGRGTVTVPMHSADRDQPYALTGNEKVAPQQWQKISVGSRVVAIVPVVDHR